MLSSTVKVRCIYQTDNKQTIYLSTYDCVVKRRRNGGTAMFYHIRLYAPEHGFYKKVSGNWIIGTCHVDCNELMTQDRSTWDSGTEWVPRPESNQQCDVRLCEVRGNSQYVENSLCADWRSTFGNNSVSSDSVNVSNLACGFEVQWKKTVTVPLPMGHTGYIRAIAGKWWNSNGEASVLTWTP